MRSLYAAAVRCTDGFGPYGLKSFSGPIPSLYSTRFSAFPNRRRTGSSHESPLETWEVKNPHYGYVFPSTEKHPRGADRKSTRLNSSHLGISYAVFCSKKIRNEQLQ